MILAAISLNTFGQYILNGDFEVNNSEPGVNQMNMDNAPFNVMVSDCFSFALPYPYANLDLITTAEWGGLAQSGDWFIGLGSTDRLSLKLSAPLVVSETYQLSWYERASADFCMGPVGIGLSTTPTATEEYLYNSPYFPEIGIWKLRQFQFIAPVAATYITVRLYSFEGCWINVDDFCLSSDLSCAAPSAISMPNVFTPSGDGSNDRFVPIRRSEITGGQLEIYNRWGDLIFNTDDLDNGWDGTANGKSSPDGTYFYRMSYTTVFNENGSTQGWVTLLGSH